MVEIISSEVFQQLKQEESLKIEKNSRGYNWEFKLIGKVEEQLERIDNINKILQSKFKNIGGKING